MRITEFGILKAHFGFFVFFLDVLPGTDRAQKKVHELKKIVWMPDGINLHWVQL